MKSGEKTVVCPLGFVPLGFGLLGLVCPRAS
jgi:hypothetical protein